MTKSKKRLIPKLKKQKVSMKAKASKALPKNSSFKSGALAEAIKRLPKTVPVANAQPDKGIIEIEAAITFADLTNNNRNLKEGLMNN